MFCCCLLRLVHCVTLLSCAAVNAEKMEDVCKRLQKSQRKDMSKKLRDSDVFRGLDQEIKNFLNTCPLIQALTHKSMRPRHWEALMKATGVEFTPPYKDPVLATLIVNSSRFILAISCNHLRVCVLLLRLLLLLTYVPSMLHFTDNGVASAA